ncbi:MAG: hypothetical protein OEV74_18180 [Cyclobacteriaceae bacterium]|nr:hypothetical protein [Cyclobacteriaceae bacterium]MDH4298212.1 hypothetical protein [Cyclobacteriaceae bacterium]MDH5248462.1 hypothetical protein [Cyclobacteriaceae bacterium]
MKLLTTVGLVVLVTIRCMAQENAEKMRIEQQVEKYHKIKTTGTTLTLLGGVLFIAGVVTTSNNQPDFWSDQPGNYAAGMGMMVLGGAGLGSGIPLWTVGAHHGRKYRNQLEGISVRVRMNRQSKGIGLIWRF